MENVNSNLDNFIYDMRNYYENYLMPETLESWEQNTWGSANKGWLLARGRVIPFRFDKIPKSKYVDKEYSVPHDYQEFMKAVLVCYNRQSSSTSSETVKHILLSLKRIYIVLLSCSSAAKPSDISKETIKEVERSLIDSGYKAVRNMLNYAMIVQGICIKYELTQHRSRYVKRRLRDCTPIDDQISESLERGYINDQIRSDSEKLISYEAFKALVTVTNSPRHDLEMLGCRIADILFATGMRINEVLYLPRDCLIKKNVSDTLASREGISDLELNTRYGLKYYPEKGAKIRPKWLESNAAKVVVRAYYDILKITKKHHEHACFLVNGRGKLLLPDHISGDFIDSEVLREEVFLSTINYGKRNSLISNGKSVEMSKRNTVKAFLKKSNIDHLNAGREEVEMLVRRYLPKGDFTEIEIPLKNQIETAKLDDFLCIAPYSALSIQRGVIVNHAVQLVSGAQFSRFLGGGTGGSVFSIRGLTESNGSKIQINTHHFRHNINTFLALAGVSEHLQAIAMGRVDISQNKAYQHLTVEEIHEEGHNILEHKERSLRSLKSEALPAALKPLNSIDCHSRSPMDRLKQGHCLNWSSSVGEQRNIESAFHSFDSNAHSQDYLSEMLSSECLAGEMQDVYSNIKRKKSKKEVDNFVKTHAGSLHILPNGSCSRNIALHKCNKSMKCLNGAGCSHLLLTGRPGELEGLLSLYQRSKENLLTLKDKFGHDENYHRAINIQEKDIQSYEILIKKAKQALSSKTPMQVFPNGDSLGFSGKSETLVDFFARAQFNSKEE